MTDLRIPRSMRIAPVLDTTFESIQIQRRYALLINPFYPKDPHASFGKHVLTPSLSLTSIAAATPTDWNVEFWDENLLQVLGGGVEFGSYFRPPLLGTPI